MGRGNAYHNQGDYEQAIVEYNQALDLEPELAEAYLNRGLAYAGLLDYEQAIADYTTSIEFAPDLVQEAKAYHNRGVSYYLSGDRMQVLSNFNQAVAYLEQVRTQGDNSEETVTELEAVYANLGSFTTIAQ